MRLLHVYSGNMYGGIEAMLQTIATTKVAALQSEVALCFEGRLGRELHDAGVPVHRVPEVRASRPHTIRRARHALSAVIRSGNFDRVICHAAWPQAVFGRAVRDTGTPLVFWVHDAMTGRAWTERWARRAPPDLAICNSRFTASTLGTIYPRVPAVVVHPPVAVPALTTAPSDRAALRREFDTPADSVVIIQATRAERWKGHLALLDALASLRHVSNWVWWIAGGAQRPAEREFMETVEATARRAGVIDRVRFVGQRSDVGRLLAAADVYAQANLRPEPFGLAFVEALAAGLPIVTMAMGGALEIVDDSCGVLVPADDTNALSAALLQMISNTAYRAQLAAAAPARARFVADPAKQIHALHDALAAMTPAHV